MTVAVPLHTRELAETDDEAPPAGPVPKEALAYFKRKKIKPGFRYTSVWQQEHALAFTVAKLMERSILEDVRAAVQSAIEYGTTLEDFKAKVGPQLEKSGWRAHVADKAVPSRLRLIYETNTRMARANGQADRVERNKNVLPFLKYDLGPSKVHRDEHKAWEGLTLPVDDDFWKTRYPPNGYGCKCRIRAISRLEAEKNGIDEAPPDDMVPYDLPDGRKGEAPRGVHPSFAYPMGSAGRKQALDDALKAATKKGEKASMQTSYVAATDIEAGMMVVLDKDGRVRPAIDVKERAAVIARELSDGARRTLAEFVAMCPSIYDTTGLTKFASHPMTTRKYIEGELARSGLVGRRESQNRCGLFPTTLARAVQALLNGGES